MRTCFALLLGLLLVFPMYAAHAGVDMAVGIWLFDEGSGDVAIDSSGNGNDAALEGGPEWVDGKFGKAISFDGVSGAGQVEDNDSIDFDGEEITITSWFWWEGSGDGWQTFVAKGVCCNNPAENYGYFINTGGGHTHFAVSPNGIRGTHNSDTNLFGAQEWHFVAVTYDGSKIKSYVDGAQMGEADASGPMTPNDNPLRIGHREASSHWWKGYLDDVGLFKSALTEDEIVSIMDNGLLSTVTAVDSHGKLATAWSTLKSQQ